MSRRSHHGRSPRPHVAARPARTASPAPERPATSSADNGVVPRPAPAADASARAALVPQPVTADAALVPQPETLEAPGRPVPSPGLVRDDVERKHLRAPVAVAAPPAAPVGPPLEAARGADPGHGEDMRPTCTVAQLRRFIKSRPWVPMHELRRRFGINGAEDDVIPIRVGDRRLYIGLPPLEGRLMAELLGSGDVGYELSLDPGAPVVVGVYPMRPVPRS